MTWPALFSSGPPELPGLMAASVWIALMYERSVCSPAVTGRSRALTIPEVTVPSRPSGAPIAMATSPTRTAPESPSPRVGRSLRSTFTTARSYAGLVPTTCPVLRDPSLKTTVSVPPPETRATTWLFVTM